MNQSFVHVEVSEDLPQACMPDPVKRLREAYEAVEQIALASQGLLYDDSAIEGMFSSAPAWSKTCLFFCQQFLDLGLG